MESTQSRSNDLSDPGSVQPPDGPSGNGASKDFDWIDRLANCNQKIEDLRVRYKDVLNVQAEKWTNFVMQPVEQRKQRNDISRSTFVGYGSLEHNTSGDPNVCSSTPKTSGSCPSMKPQSDLLGPTDTKLAKAPSTGVVLFNEDFSEDVDRHRDFEWPTADSDNERDDDFEGKPIAALEPSTWKTALKNQTLTLPDNNPSIINASWNSKSTDQKREDHQKEQAQGHQFDGNAGGSLIWTDRLTDCLRMIDDLSARYGNILSTQAKKWDNFVAETLDGTEPHSACPLRRPRIWSSSTPKSVRLTPTRLGPSSSEPTEKDLPGATPNRIVLFGGNSAENANQNHNFEWKTGEDDEEPDDDFRDNPIGRLDASTFKNALRCSEGVFTQVSVP